MSPKYKINFCWKNIRRNNFLSPKLKTKIDTVDKNCSVYNFLCDCFERYIGESKRQLKVRIQEHQQESRETAVVQHTLKFPIYQNLFKTALGESPTFNDRIYFLQDRFTIFFSNLTNGTEELQKLHDYSYYWQADHFGMCNAYGLKKGPSENYSP